MSFASQSFTTGDILSVLFLVLLEGALSADNALVLAMMVKHLPKDEQKKALLYGLGGAFVFRFLAIVLATQVLKLWWLQAIGAASLIGLSIKHLMSDENVGSGQPKRKKGGLWPTIIAVEATDIAFAIDSVLAGVGFVNNRQDKIWVVYVGAAVGMVLLRFAASFIIRLLDKYPFLDKVAYALVLWVGVKLGWLSFGNFAKQYWPGHHIGEMPLPVFWIGLFVIGSVGTFIAVRRPDTQPPDEDCEAAQTMFTRKQPESVKRRE